jgi:uncharacterized protein (DUF2235 family)
MRYYNSGDQIYIFGFSRGAFTARFLTRMIAHVGLLSKGNEEMISFAYSAYQDYEAGTGERKTPEENEEFFNQFMNTFCRANVLVHFLGLFDTVRSVGTFDAPGVRTSFIPVFKSYARHVRHAVSIDERRSKFKPALLCQEKKKDSSGIIGTQTSPDIKEVWFPGNHGDIGGGWANPPDDPDSLQLSSIPLEWMVKELQDLPVEENSENIMLNEFATEFLQKVQADNHRAKALTNTLHDVLTVQGGGSWLGVIFWNMMG